MTSIGHIGHGSGGAGNGGSDDDGVKKAAQGLEAHFLRQILAQVRESSSSEDDGGFAGSTFKEMLDGALADSMASAGGIGLGKMIEKELSKTAGGAKSSAPSAKLTEGTGGTDGIAAMQSLKPLAGLPVRPVTGIVTSRYGTRVDPLEGDTRVHAGVDLRAAEGTPARAAQAGTVVRAEPAGGYGNLVVVDHGNGLETRYGHLSRIDVQVGQKLDAGQPVGEVGATGRATGPHLHFEVRRNGRTVDPTLAPQDSKHTVDAE